MTVPGPRPPTAAPLLRAPWLAAALLAGVIVAAYANSLGGPFVFDDLPSIPDNATIRSFVAALFPPAGGLTVSGRPLLNLTFALNHAVSGDAPWSYHAGNVLIHVLAALTLFGLLRRTFQLPTLAPRYGAGATGLPLALAALWALHPLQTESVTYIVQRAESLAALWTLLTLYCFVRGAQAAAPSRWFAVGAGAMLLGVLSKETAAVAPVLVLLYDRTFVSGTFRAAWARHRGFYLPLAASWLVLAALLLSTGNRGGTTGFATPVTSATYALIQLPALARYLGLSLWPANLVFDYGPFQAVAWPSVVIGAVIVVPLLALTVWALRRHPAVGFLGAWFFVALAPSSSVVPVASQIMAEHRMYLALAAVVMLLGLVAWRSLGRFFPWTMLLLCGVCFARTGLRNTDYRSGLQLWEATARDCPANPRAHLNLGQAMTETDNWAGAGAEFASALRLQPDYIAAHYNLGLVAQHFRRFDEAGEHFSAALRGNPALFEAAYDWGNALAAAGRPADAAERYRYALGLRPGDPPAHYNLGNSLIELGRLDEAIAQYREAVRLDPGHTGAHFNLGGALAQTGHFAEAAAQFEAVLRLNPQDAEAARNLALAKRMLLETTNPH